MQQAGAIGQEDRDPRVRTAGAASLIGTTSSITIGRMLWTRALPGTVAVIAALTLPEFSLGAGDLADGGPTVQPTSAPALVPSRPAVPPPAFAPIAEGRPPEGLRNLLGPVITQPAPPASEPVAEIRARVAIVPDVSEQVDPGLAAEIEVVTPPPASRPIIAEPTAFVAQAPAGPAIPVETVALARRETSALVEPFPAALAPEPAQTPEPVAGATAQRSFGGAKGSFVALAPSLTTVPNMALAFETAIVAAPTVPAGVDDAAPGRRPALTALAPTSAAPDQAGQQARSQETLPIAEPRMLASAGNTVPAGLGAAVAVPAPARAAGPAATPTAVSAPVVVTQAAVLPAPARSPVAAARNADPVVSNGSAPARTRSAALTAPAPKVPVAALAARLRAATRAAAGTPAPARPAAPASAPTQAGPAQANSAAIVAPLPRTKPQQPAAGLGKSDAFQLDIRAQLVTRVDGMSAGKVDFQQTDAGLMVRLGSIVELLGDRYDNAQIARIRASAASDLYLSLAQLQVRGIPISYDPVYDEFNVGMVDTRPKAARKVHMDQISTPERGLGSTGVNQVRR